MKNSLEDQSFAVCQGSSKKRTQRYLNDKIRDRTYRKSRIMTSANSKCNYRSNSYGEDRELCKFTQIKVRNIDRRKSIPMNNLQIIGRNKYYTGIRNANILKKINTSSIHNIINS